MSIQFKPIEFAGDNLTNVTPKQLYDAFVERGLVLLRREGRELTPQRQVELARVFGEPEIHPIEALRHPDCPEMIVLAANGAGDIPEGDSRRDELVGEVPWHSDLSYVLKPSRGAALHAITVPSEGGLTGWIDTVGLYDALSEDLKKRIEGLQVVHSFAVASGLIRKSKSLYGAEGASSSQKTFPEVIHPLVYVHPENGRKVLNISPLFASRILDLSAAEGDALLAELKTFATQESRAYIHHWRKGDVVIWDNLYHTIHRAYGCPRKCQRVMHRVTFMSKSEGPVGRLA